MKFSGKFSVSCWSYTYVAYVVCHSSIEEKVSNFSGFTHTPIRAGMMTETLARVVVLRA
jgi:hypothetical protein